VPVIMAVTETVAGGLRAETAGVTHLLVRKPSATAAEQYAVLAELVARARMPVLVRSRVDFALAAGAAGVNLPEGDVGVRDARRLLGDDRLLGRSVHSAAAAFEAGEGGADFVLFGPIFETPTHPGSGVGLAALAEVVRAAGELPVIAIGGIDRARSVACLEAGAAGYAAIRLFA
jgi:thiamine-phosphate pyrophosphorylase